MQEKELLNLLPKQGKDYDAIKKFYDANIENFTELTPENQNKADRINDFLKLEYSDVMNIDMHEKLMMN